VLEVAGEKKIMLDPFTALAAISTAVKLVKKTVATVQDIESLGPVLGQYFSAKADAIEVVSKGGFSGSAKGQAIELEMAIESARAFEEEIKMLFFSSNKMDVWQKIVARTAKIERDHAIAEGKRKAAAAKHKKEMDEVITIVLMLLVFVLVLGGVGWVVYEAVQQCKGKC
jgi:hypothetical protein